MPKPPQHLIDFAKKHKGDVLKWKEYPEKGYTNLVLKDGRKFVLYTSVPIKSRVNTPRKSTAKRKRTRTAPSGAGKPRKENDA